MLFDNKLLVQYIIFNCTIYSKDPIWFSGFLILLKCESHYFLIYYTGIYIFRCNVAICFQHNNAITT